MSYPYIFSELDPIVVSAVEEEITRGNKKHGHGPIATPLQVGAILMEELGEYIQAVMQERLDDAIKELNQIAAVACNALTGKGSHYSNKA